MGGWRGMDKKAMGIRRYNVNSHGDVKDNVRTVNITITSYCDRWIVDFLWQSLCKVHKCEISLCSTPETNTMLYVNYTLIQKSFAFQNKIRHETKKKERNGTTSN